MMEKASLSRRRKALFDVSLGTIASDLAALGSTAQRAADRLLIRAADGTELLIHLASVKEGYGFQAGEFGVYFSVILGKGPIHDLMQRLRLLPDAAASDGRIFQIGSLDLRKGGALYELRSSHEPVKVARRLAADMKKLALPRVRSIIERRADVSRLATETPDAFEKPFGTVAAVLALRGKLSELEKFWTATDGRDDIWDRPTRVELKLLMRGAAALVRP